MKTFSPYPTNLLLSKNTPVNRRHLLTQFDKVKSRH